MEEKDIIRTEEDSLQQPQQTGALTPDGSILGGYDNNLPVRRESVASGNISNAFLSSMTATSEGIHKKYPNLELSESEEKLRTDKEGNKVRYTRRQKLTLLALTQELSKHSEDKEVKELIERMEKANSIEEYKKLANAKVSVHINLMEVCRLVDGEVERWREENQETLREELKKISMIRQLYLQDIEISKPDGTKEKIGVLKHFKPYISLTNDDIILEMNDGGKAIATEITFQSIFFDKLLDRYAQLPKEAFDMKSSKGRRLSNDVYLSLLLVIMPLRWAHVFWNYHRAKESIKKKDIIDPDKRERILEEALTHAPISFDLIKEITEKDYGKYRSEKKRFNSYLQEALTALIEIGILLDKSRIDWEKENITVVFNPNYTTLRQKKLDT